VPVLDASVLVEYLVGVEHVQEVRSHVVDHARGLWAPHLVDAEVGHVLRRAVARGDLTTSLATAALSDLASFPLHRVAHVGLLHRAWALRENVSFYDGLYVALAERLDEPLVTLDARLATAPGVAAQVVVVG